MESAPPITIAEIDRMFTGGLPPVKLPPTYRLALAGCTAGLILLQLAYLALVAAAAFATIAYVIWAVPAILAEIRVNWLTIVLIGGPPIAGAIATFFLFKPLLSRLKAPPPELELRRQDAPVLFHFVEQLCAAMGAPPPRRIHVDLQVNASASLGQRFRNVFFHDLTLTIGLPLVSGLTLRQFAGVLAHELGHFSQGAGMRLTFTMGYVQFWFSRVAHERDRWDVWLEESIRTSGWRWRSVLRIAEAAVGFSRWVLRGLLQAGQWITAWFQRQKEFDADRCSAALVGGKTVEETSLRLPVLSTACHYSWQDVNQSWGERRLPVDFSGYTQLRAQAFSEETRERILRSELEETTDRWATHPSTADRIRNVEGTVGMLTEPLDQPASCLFEDYIEVCERATRFRYELDLGEALAGGQLIDHRECHSQVSIQQQRQAAVERVFPQMSLPSRWFCILAEPSEEAGPCPGEGDPSAPYWSLLELALDRFSGTEYLRAGGKINAASFSLSSTTLAVAEEETAASRANLRREVERLTECYSSSATLLSKDPDLRAAYNALAAEQRELIELRQAWVAVRVLREHPQHIDAAKAAVAESHHSAQIRQLLAEILGRLEAVRWPLEVPVGSGSLAAQITRDEEPNVAPYERAERILARADVCAEQLLGELCRAVE